MTSTSLALPRDEVRRRILSAAARPGGMNAADILGISAHRVHQMIGPMVRDGLLFKAKLGHRTVRFFTDREAAAKCERDAARPVNVSPSARSMRAAFSPDDPPIITERTKITRCPPMPQPTRTNTHSQFA